MNPALLVHSGGFTSRQWRRLREQLAVDRTVLAPDLLGYGAAPWPAGEPFDCRADVELVIGLLDDLATPTHLVGHSYGGFIAAQAALARPGHVRSLAVYEPVTFGVLEPGEDDAALASIGQIQSFRPEDPDAWLSAFVDWWNGPGAWSRLPSTTQDDFRRVGWKLSEEVRSLALDRTTRAQYGAITSPTLVLAGTRTQPAELAVVERFAAALPHARLERLEGLGHMGPITHAPQVNAAIGAHIAAS